MDKINSRDAGHGKQTWLEVATFVLPDGREKVVDIAHRPAAVAVIPVRVTDNGTVEVLLVREPRPAVGEEALLEVVAGTVDDTDETMLGTAQRELGEEAGLYARAHDVLASRTLPAPGYTDELIYIVAAWGLSEVPRREEHAHIHPEWVPLEHAVAMVCDGEIRDMKAMLALLLLAEKQRRDPHAYAEWRDA